MCKNNHVLDNLSRLTNQVYKLLPLREENKEWKKPLNTIIIELKGLNVIFPDFNMLTLLSKLEGLHTLTQDNDFLLFRGTVFECLGLIEEVKTYVNERNEG